MKACLFCILSRLVCSTLCLCSIGSVLDAQGKPEEALAIHQKSLDIKLNVFGPDHPDIAVTYNNIGVVYLQQAKYPEALNMYQKSLNIDIKVHSCNHPCVADTLYKIAHIYESQELFESAAESYDRLGDRDWAEIMRTRAKLKSMT